MKKMISIAASYYIGLASLWWLGGGGGSSLIVVDAASPIQPSIKTTSKLDTLPTTQINIKNNLQRRQTTLSIPQSSFTTQRVGWNIIPRGGGALDILSDDDDDIDEYDESEEEELSENEPSSEAEEELEDDTPTSAASASGPPVKLTIKTSLSSKLIDQKLEFTASRTRTIQSIKLALSKTMVGRPPVSSIVLKYHGRTLIDDDEIVNDLLQDYDSDDEEDFDSDVEEDTIGEEDDDEDVIKLTFNADIVPPIDTKFGIELREYITKMSTKDILEAYCINMAGMMYESELYLKECELYDEMEKRGDDESGELENDDVTSTTTLVTENHSLNIRKRAAIIQKQFESTLTDETKQLIQEEDVRVKKYIAADTTSDSGGDVGGGSSEEVFGLVHQGGGGASRSGRKGRTLKGGATMNVKRSLQRNMNVNWADTTRNSLLFLFFGYFGGRNSFSRALLLLASPLCFLIQTRPMKVAMKQVFYTIGEPPGIFLSLLPAPQQAIMSLNYGNVMRGLYGEKVLEKGGNEEWLEMERMEMNDAPTVLSERMRGDVYDDEYDDLDDDEYDQYDDDESDYDSDDGDY